MKCPVCLTTDHVYFMSTYDDRYAYPGLFELRKCVACGHRFLINDFTPDFLEKLYTDYYPRSTFDLDHHQPSPAVKGFKSWLNGERSSVYCWVLKKNARILDIGCGFGEALAYHKSRGCDVYGVEADENIRRVADKFGYNVQVGLFDPEIYDADFFDYVTMNQVIEHMIEPLDTMRGIARVLKPGGLAILSTPNADGLAAKFFGRRWINWHVPYHTQLFTRKSMRLAAEQAGLSLERVRTITSSEWLHYQWLHLLTFPAPCTPSSFWSPYAKPDIKAWFIIKILSQVHRTKVNHFITRILDALGVGDNILFFLRKT